MKIIRLILFVITIISGFSSCAIGNSTEGNLKVVNQKRELSSNFTEIEVSHGINVYLRQGIEYSMNVELDENLHDLLITKIENNTLKIYFSEDVGRRKSSIVHLSMPLILKLTSNNNAEISSQNQLNVQDIILTASNGGEIKLDLIANQIQCTASNDGDVHLTGTTKLLVVNASNDSDIEAKELVSQSVEATASSDSDIDVQVIVSLNAIANSDSKIKYWGDPTELNIEKSSEGEIEKQNP